MRKYLKVFLFTLVFFFVFSYFNVQAESCTKFDIDKGGFPVKSITINGEAWNSSDDTFETNGGNYTIVILAGKNGSDFPELSTPGGLGEVVSVQNSGSTGDNDKYKFTVTVKNHNNGQCSFIGGLELKSGPEPKVETHEETASVTITIKGEELEYHYVESEPDKADVTYFKFDINGGTEEERLVPFTFGNANYTHNDKEPPKNVTQVTTKNPILYKYQYDGKGKVEFCVNGGQTDEYTSIKINGVEYSQYAAHDKEDYWETTDGWAQMFCIPNVDYSKSYNVVVEGKQTTDENKIPGFGWSYLTKERSTDIDEEGNFAHGRLQFVSASLEIDGEVKTFSSATAFNNYKYHDKGHIFQWGEGDKEYPEADRRLAWGSAKMPYGTTLRVRIVPDKGYQLTGLTVSENGFKATDTPGEYELTLTKTNLSYDEDQNQFNLNPKFEKVDATATSEASAVSNVVVTIDKGENAFGTGTPKLEVTDVKSMSPERENEFDKATNEGFTINNFLEISLYNAIYKGGKKTNNKIDSWDTEIHELQNKATIGLELDEALNGNEVQVIHEVRDNDNKIVGYDVIDAQYDKARNTVTFETDGFSTYAIAVKKSEENNQTEKEMVKIDFDLRCPECSMEPVEIEKGTKFAKPKDPVSADLLFVGWYSDENCENPFDFDKAIEKDTILYAKWSDKVQEYTVKDSKGNSLTFNEIKNRSYELTLIDIVPLTDAELKAMGATREQYNQVKSAVTSSTSKYGELIAFYQIEIKDKDDGAIISEGPFKIKIKITDAMKKFNVFKLVYVNDDFEAEEVIDLKVENGYLVGEIPHLSAYTLNATYDSNLPDVPKTGDNIYTWVMLLIISSIGLSVGVLKYYKQK